MPYWGIAAEAVNSGHLADAMLLRALVSPAARYQIIPVRMFDFCDESEWDTYHASKAEISSTFMAARGLGTSYSAKCIQMNHGGDGTATVSLTRDFDPVIDLSAAQHIEFAYYLPDPANAWAIGELCIRLRDSTGKLREWRAYNNGVEGTEVFNTAHISWNRWTGTVTEYQDEDAGFDISDVDRVYIDMKTFPPYTSTPYAYLGRLMFFKSPLSKGLVIVGFDGSYDSQLDAAAYLAAHGMRATFYTQYNRIGTSGRLTVEQLKRMKQMGHVLGIYPGVLEGGAGNWGEQTFAQKLSVLARDCRGLFDYGVPIEGLTHMSAPTGNMRADDVELLRGGYVSSLAGLTGHSQARTNFSPIEPRLLPASANTSDGHAYRAARLANAITDKAVSFWIYHEVTGGAGNVPWEFFEDDVGSLATERDAGNIEVVTPVDLLLGRVPLA